MSRIIFVPQYPTPMRYQEWWFNEFPKEFKKAGLDVVVLGEGCEQTMKRVRGLSSNFSPIEDAILFETAQINQYMKLKIDYDNDIVFMADISFPGLFGNVLFHKTPSKVFGFCHATSLNHLDYFERDRFRKFRSETATAYMCTHVFVGSRYHQEKLRDWKNTQVTYLPYPPITPYRKVEWKKNDIISVARPTNQKMDGGLEIYVEECLKTTVKRREFSNWQDYYKFIAESKVMLITAQEETFGYQIVDAVMNGCIPLAPNRCCYHELLPPEFIYDSREELLAKLDYMINSDVKIPEVPELICHGYMKHFYSNIIAQMTEDAEVPF